MKEKHARLEKAQEKELNTVKEFQEQAINKAQAKLEEHKQAVEKECASNKQHYENRKAEFEQKFGPVEDIDLEGMFAGLRNDIRSAEAKIVDDYRFTTASNTSDGRDVRDMYKEALKLRNGAQKDGSKEKIKNAELLIDIVKQSDTLMASGGFADYSQRLMRQAMTLQEFLEGGEDLAQLQRNQMDSGIKKEFKLRSDSSSFLGTEIVLVANRLADFSETFTDDIIRLHAGSSLLQAEIAMDAGDYKRALANINRGWALVDYLKGAASGMAQFVGDTVSGFGAFVMHPIDSVESIYFAIKNYDKTLELIKHQMQNVWESYDDLNAEEKGELHASIAAEILSVIVPGGSVKNLGKVSKIGNAVGKFVEQVSKTDRVLGTAVEGAKKLNYAKTNYRLHGQPVFKSGNKYITPDCDSHGGGVWKMADSVENLRSKSTRMGTYDAGLNRIGD